LSEIPENSIIAFLGQDLKKRTSLVQRRKNNRTGRKEGQSGSQRKERNVPGWLSMQVNSGTDFTLRGME